MINWTDSNIVWTGNRTLTAAAVGTVSEGQGLVGGFANGQPTAQPATGSTSDGFLGIAMGPRANFSTNSIIEAITVPSSGPYTVLLKNTAVGSIGTYQVGGTLVASSGSAASTTNVNVSTDATTGFTLLTFDSSFAGQAFTAAYNYTMTAQQQVSLYGNPYPGFPSEQVLSQVVVGIIGRFVVNNYSPTANWYGGTGLPTAKLVAAGVWTDSSNAATGITPTNVRIAGLPTPSYPWLTLEVR